MIMQIFQSLAQKGSQFSVTYPDGTKGTKTARYDVGEIKGKYRDMLAVIADASGFDGLGFDSTVGSADDSWHTVNLFTRNHRYIDTVAVAGADDSDHAIYVALSQFDYLEPDYGKLVANNPESGFDNLGFSADTIQKLLDNPSQNQHYLPIISKKMLLDEQYKASFDDVAWDGLNLVSHGRSFDNLYRDMLKHDTFGELMEEFSLRQALAQFDDIGELGFDSLMDTHNRLQLMGDRLYRGLVSAGDKELQVTSFNLTKPFKRQGVANVAMDFGLSDGQTFSIFFKNPDADPAKIGANDVMVSWKWLLNKKDITAVVQPENGANVQLSQVAMRMMKLAKANMGRFASAQAQKAKNEQEINNAKQAVANKQALLETLDKEIADLQAQIDVKRHEPKQAFVGDVAGVENQDESDEPINLTGDEFDYEQNSQEIDVSNIDTDLDKYGKDNKTAVIKFLKTLQGKYINTQIGKVLFNRDSIDELPLGTKNNDIRAKLVFYVPQTLKNGEYAGKEELKKDRKDNFVAFHKFINSVQIGDEMVKHCVKVGERPTGEFVFVAYHSRGLYDSINTKKPVFDSISNNMVGRSQTGLDDIVLDEADDVNDDIIIDDDTPSLFDSMMFDDIADDTDGWNIQIISITPIANKIKELFGKTKPVNRKKLIKGLRFIYADDFSMWSNGHIMVKESVSDALISQADYGKQMPVSQLERLIPPKAIQLQLVDLATSADKKETQLAILKTEQGNEVAIDKTYLQFFIKEFGNQLEYWGDDIDFEISNGGNGTRRPISLYKGGEFIGLIMPTTHNYIKHSEQELKQDKPVITEIVNPYDESQVQEKLKNAKQKYENFGEKSLAPHEKMPANGQTVKLENARQFLLDKVLKGKQKNVIFTFKDDKGNLGFKIGVDTNANRRKLIDAFGEIDTHRLPHEQAGGQANGGDITSARILERLGYVIDYTEKETFYPKSALPIKNQFYQIDLNGHQGAYLFVGIVNKQQLKDEADLRFLDLESDYLMSMKASRYDELMNANKIVKIDDMTTITELVNHNAKKEHSIYQTRANGQIIKVFAKGNRYHIEQYQNVNDKSPYTVEVDSKSEAVSELQQIKKHYPVLKFVTGVENLLELTIKEPVKDNEAVENLEKDFFNMAKRFGFQRQDIEKETYNLDNGGKVNQYVINVFFDDYPEVTLYTEYHYNSSQGTKVISRMSDDGELWLIENDPLKGLQDFKDYVEKIQNPLDESTPASQDESQILKSELLKLGFNQNGNDFTQLFLRGKYNQTNIKLRLGNHALKFEIDQYDKNSRSYPVNKVIDFNELNANDIITTIKRYIKGYKANGAITNYNSVNMQDVDMLIVLKPQFEQLGFDYVTLNEGRLGFYLTMKKDDMDVKITPKGEDVEVSCFNQFVDDKEVFATTDIQGIVDFVQDMLASSKEYQTEQDEQQAFSDDSDKLYEYLDKGWSGDGDKEDLKPILDKYRHDPRLSEQVAQWERQHENWLQENNMNESNYTQSDIDYLQSIINGTLQLTLANKDEILLELERIAEKGEIDEKLLDDAMMTYTNFVSSIKVG